MTSTMDVDFWSSSRVRSARHHQPSLLNQVLEDSEGEDDDEAFFPCPFCYVEVDVNVLCRHSQNEHCFDLKNAVCQLCAANLGKQPTGNFGAQHSSSLKRRRGSHKSIFWSSNSATPGNELTSFLGSKANVRERHPTLCPIRSYHLSCAVRKDIASKMRLPKLLCHLLLIQKYHLRPMKMSKRTMERKCRESALFNSLSLLPSSKASFGLNTRKPNWRRT